MLLWLLACGPAPEPAGSWVAGDLHVHSSVGSNDTDGLGTPEVLADAMAAAGLAFLFVTEHSNSQGSMHCEDVEDCPNLGPELAEADWPEGVWLGSEISPVASIDPTSEPTGHVGCLPLDGASFPGLDAFVDRPTGTVTGGDAVEQCVGHGGFAIVNHPHAAAGWIAYDWTSESFDALEVYNGGARFDPWDAEGVAAWEARVAAGAAVVPVGGSDCHRWGTEPPGSTLDPALGWPTTWVNLREGERPVDGLVAGRVVIAEPGTTLSLVASSRRAAVGPGERVAGPVTVRVESAAAEAGLEVQLKAVGGEVLATGAVGEALELEVAAGIVYARVWPVGEIGLGTGGVAITAPVWVD